MIEGECDTAPFTQVDDLELSEGRVDRHHREGGIDRRQPVVAGGIHGGATQQGAGIIEGTARQPVEEDRSRFIGHHLGGEVIGIEGILAIAVQEG